MTDPLELMDEIDRSRPILRRTEFERLRTVLEAQAEELAQKDVRIAELENAMLDMRKISQGGSISAADGMEMVIDEVMAASEREAKEASDE